MEVVGLVHISPGARRARELNWENIETIRSINGIEVPHLCLGLKREKNYIIIPTMGDENVSVRS